MSINRTAYNALLDDDGSNTVGSAWTKTAIKDVLLDPIDTAIICQGVTQTTTSTGTVNDFALSTGAALLRLNNASLLTLTGMTAGLDGQVLDLVSIGAGRVDLMNLNTGSSSANRIINPISGTISLSPNSGRCRLRYDGTTGQWRVLEHEQGAWITPTFSAGNFAGNGSMTWTVGSGDVQNFSYHLRGRTLRVVVYVGTTTVGGTLSTALVITIPASFTAVGSTVIPIYISNNGTLAAGLCIISGTSMSCYKVDQTNWAAATDATLIGLSVNFEVV